MTNKIEQMRKIGEFLGTTTGNFLSKAPFLAYMVFCATDYTLNTLDTLQSRMVIENYQTENATYKTTFDSKKKQCNSNIKLTNGTTLIDKNTIPLRYNKNTVPSIDVIILEDGTQYFRTNIDFSKPDATIKQDFFENYDILAAKIRNEITRGR